MVSDKNVLERFDADFVMKIVLEMKDVSLIMQNKILKCQIFLAM